MDVLHNSVQQINTFPPWAYIGMGIGALSVIGCVIAFLCRRRFREKKNSPFGKEKEYSKIDYQKVSLPVHEQTECVIENEEKRPEPECVMEDGGKGLESKPECVMEEEGKGLESKPVQPDCIIGNEEKKSVEEKENVGELYVSLGYKPKAGKLTVGILAARNLLEMDVIGKSDPYVKLALYKGKKRLNKKKTTVKKCTLNPVYNESFKFKVPSKRIGQVALVVSVVDYDRFKSSELIGKVVLASSATGDGQKHWNEMLSKPRQQISQWHVLQDFSK